MIPVLVVVDHPGEPTVEIRALCGACGGLVTARTYDVRLVDPTRVDLDVLVDAHAMHAHHCGGRASG